VTFFCLTAAAADALLPKIFFFQRLRFFRVLLARESRREERKLILRQKRTKKEIDNQTTRDHKTISAIG
jgi:hypothetical protein